MTLIGDTMEYTIGITAEQLHQILDSYQIEPNSCFSASNSAETNNNPNASTRHTIYSGMEFEKGPVTLHTVRIIEPNDEFVGPLEEEAPLAPLLVFDYSVFHFETQSQGSALFSRQEYDPPQPYSTYQTITSQEMMITSLEDFIHIKEAIFETVCPEKMIFIPEREYPIGYNQGDFDEAPERNIYLSAFCMNQHEVTNKEFKQIDPNAKRLHTPYSRPDQPRVMVTWHQAQSFCKLQYNGGSLPNEWQWEAAGRAGRPPEVHATGSGKVSPNDARRSIRRQRTKIPTVDVCSFAPNPLGLCDMAGNAKEWTLSNYDPYYLQKLSAKTLHDPLKVVEGKTVRGGSYRYNVDRDMRPSNRMYFHPNTIEDDLGFRCIAKAKILE